jgi:TonB family protein
VHHRGTEYHGIPPWMKECAKGPPFYPYEARRFHQQGTVIVHVTLNLETGKIQEATIAKSSGFPVLDNGALTTIHKWRWLPGKWKEIVIPIEFTLLKGPGPEQPTTVRQPNM